MEQLETLKAIISGIAMVGIFILVLNKKNIRRYLIQNSDEIEAKAKSCWRKVCSFFRK